MTYLNCYACPEAAALEDYAIGFTEEYFSNNKQELNKLTNEKQIDEIYDEFMKQLDLSALKIAIEHTLNKLKDNKSDSEEVNEVISDSEEETNNEVSIYCYIDTDWDDYSDSEEHYILGLMDSINHGWDTDCFHTIKCKKSFSQSVRKLHNMLKSIDITDCVDQDNANWRYSIVKAEISSAKHLLRSIDEI